MKGNGFNKDVYDNINILFDKYTESDYQLSISAKYLKDANYCNQIGSISGYNNAMRKIDSINKLTSNSKLYYWKVKSFVIKSDLDTFYKNTFWLDDKYKVLIQ